MDKRLIARYMLNDEKNYYSSNGEYTYLVEVEDETFATESPSNISVGDIVQITSDTATYLDTGERISNSVKSESYSVSAVSDDGSIALLNYSSDESKGILTSTFNLTRASDKNYKELTEEEISTIEGKKTDTNKYDNSGTEQNSTAASIVMKNSMNLIKEAWSDTVDYYAKQGSESFARVLDDGISVESMRGIFGMPYQYMPIADRRVRKGNKGEGPETDIGRKFGEKIIARMPLLVMTPGLPEFMPGYSEEEKKSILDYAAAYAMGTEKETSLEDLIKRSGKYYTLSPARHKYFNYVNPLCRVGARYLGLHKEVLNKKPLDQYDWDLHVNNELYDTLTYRSGVAFYINSETQISDNFNNSDTESQLASKINGVSDIGREINFLLGTMSSQTGVEFDKFTSQRAVAQNMENQADMASRLFGQSGGMGAWFKNLTNQMSVIASGGKLVFPNIWSDSDFSRQYNVTIKLVSPDYDVYSWYLNIFVPLMHILCMVAPRQMGPNGFISPFLVKAYYKGLFNCDLGLITSLDVSKGSEGGWTRNGLPTTVDVSFTIKDLYKTLSISDTKGVLDNNIISNIILMDYVANLCGININKPDIRRMIDFYYTQGLHNQIKDKLRVDVFGGFDQWATNKMMGIYNRR